MADLGEVQWPDGIAHSLTFRKGESNDRIVADVVANLRQHVIDARQAAPSTQPSSENVLERA